jgi:pseudouridine-5'-phosphate glycosidase
MDQSILTIIPEIQRALKQSQPIVALESTVITHGLPRPQNLELARELEQEVRRQGAVPATIAVIDGRVRIGLAPSELELLANADTPIKISQRDFAAAIIRKSSGGTTVAGTMYAAHRVGIKVFATGGIGGIHRESHFDISADLQALAGTPMVVVCAGAKSILDLPATLEYLETMGVPVVGYQTDEFPAFYSTESGLTTSIRLDSPGAIVAFARVHWGLGMKSAVLVTQPIPLEFSLPRAEIDPLIEQASREAQEKNIHGQALTPYLLSRINELSNGKSLHANLSLLRNNASLAAQIAKTLSAGQRQRII